MSTFGDKCPRNGSDNGSGIAFEGPSLEGGPQRKCPLTGPPSAPLPGHLGAALPSHLGDSEAWGAHLRVVRLWRRSKTQVPLYRATKFPFTGPPSAPLPGQLGALLPGHLGTSEAWGSHLKVVSLVRRCTTAETDSSDSPILPDGQIDGQTFACPELPVQDADSGFGRPLIAILPACFQYR